MLLWLIISNFGLIYAGYITVYTPEWGCIDTATSEKKRTELSCAEASEACVGYQYENETCICVTGFIKDTFMGTEQIMMREGATGSSGNCRYRDSVILANNAQAKSRFLGLIGSLNSGNWRKCYIGDQGADFHSQCDLKGPTITIIKSSNGRIFGAYAPLSWNGNGNTASSSAFIFSTDQIVKMMSTVNPQYAMYSSSSYGPTFGGGYDLYISNNCKTGSSSYSNLGHSYQLPATGYNVYGSTEASALLAGSRNFNCDVYEVYYKMSV